MHRKWTPLWRKSVDSPVFKDANIWKLWTWLLMNAAYENTTVTMSTGRGDVLVPLKPGQCVVGRKSGADAMGWPSSTFRNRLEKLTKKPLECVVLEPDTHWSVVTVVNWESYRAKGQATGQAKGQPKDTKKKLEEVIPLETLFPGKHTDQFFVQVWADWEAHRAEIKKPNTNRARKLQAKALEGLTTQHAIATLEHSIMNRWQGLFPDKVRQTTGRTYASREEAMKRGGYM